MAFAHDHEKHRHHHQTYHDIKHRGISKSHNELGIGPVKTAKTSNKKPVPIGHEMYNRAKVTTMEAKFTISPFIAEFWCTVTSPAFAMPVIVWLLPLTNADLVEYFALNGMKAPPKLFTLEPRAYVQLSWLAQFSILFSIFTASMSAVYHKTLYKIFSSVDCGFASGMCFLLTFQSWVPILRSTVVQQYGIPINAYDTVASIGAIVGLSLILHAFVWHWNRSTAVLSVQVMATLIPLLLSGTYLTASSNWLLNIIGISAVACFVADRKKISASHWGWHILGGIYIGFVQRSLILANAANLLTMNS